MALNKITFIVLVVIAVAVGNSVGCIEDCDQKTNYCVGNCLFDDKYEECLQTCTNERVACCSSVNKPQLSHKNKKNKQRNRRAITCSKKCLVVIGKCFISKISVQLCVSMLKPSCIKSCDLLEKRLSS